METDKIPVPRGLLREIDRLLTGLRHLMNGNEAARDRISEYQDQIRALYTGPGFREVKG
jgi:hypothetical protein